MASILSENLDIINMLIEAGARIYQVSTDESVLDDIKYKKGINILEMAKLKGNKEIISLIEKTKKNK